MSSLFKLLFFLDYLCFTAKAIDRYIQSRSAEQSSSKQKIDSRLQAMIEGIFGRCISDGEFKQVMHP